MKQLALCAIAALSSWTISAQQVITGTVTGAQGKTLYVFSDEDNNPKDSVVLKDGTFSFNIKPTANKSIHALILQGVDYPFLFVPGNEPVKVTINGADFPLATSVKGDNENMGLQAYQQTFSPLIKRAQALNVEAGDITEDNETAKAAFRVKASKFNEDVLSTGKKFVKEHPKQLASVWVLLNELRNRLEPEEFEKAYTSLDQSVKDTKYGRSAANFLGGVKAKQSAESGEAADFSQEDMNGKPVKLSSFRGKYVLVDFWASWCGPCRAENPNVVKAFERFKDKNFTILGVSLDNNRDRWIGAVKQDGLNWTQVSDLKGWGNQVAQMYQISAIPANLLIDPNGKIIGRNLRGRALEAKLEQVFKM